MNFLAHCLLASLAGSDEPQGLVVGGILGDFLKGPVPEHLPVALADGVRLHRRIDAFSNRHDAIRASCERFPSALRRPAPVFVDIIGDHCLSLDWRDYTSTPLPSFTRDVYHTVAEHLDWFPDHGRRFMDYASSTDLLGRYGQWSTVERALASVSRRLRLTGQDDVLFTTSAAALDGLQADSRSYFPDLIVHAREWVATRSHTR
jgi:acyl carrier protein phosphodiesterase